MPGRIKRGREDLGEGMDGRESSTAYPQRIPWKGN